MFNSLFYYIEVYNIQYYRDQKLSEILGEGKYSPKYLSGSLVKLVEFDNLYSALFWKNIETAEYRIESLCKNPKIRDNYKFKIKSLTSDEFIKAIPNKITIKNVYEIGYWDTNRRRKEKEIGDRRKLKNNT